MAATMSTTTTPRKPEQIATDWKLQVQRVSEAGDALAEALRPLVALYLEADKLDPGKTEPCGLSLPSNFVAQFLGSGEGSPGAFGIWREHAKQRWLK